MKWWAVNFVKLYWILILNNKLSNFLSKKSWQHQNLIKCFFCSPSHWLQFGKFCKIKSRIILQIGHLKVVNLKIWTLHTFFTLFWWISLSFYFKFVTLNWKKGKIIRKIGLIIQTSGAAWLGLPPAIGFDPFPLPIFQFTRFCLFNSLLRQQ